MNPGWRKSSYSDNGGASCIEAGKAPGAVLVRDTTQHGRGPVLQVSLADWRRFAAAVRTGQVIS
jgi:hypothetical protein